MAKHIEDENVLRLLSQIIDSFNTEGKIGDGLPLGNLTSQLFVNIYMNEFDQFMKRELKAGYYIRYCDDFVILSENNEQLKDYISTIKNFLASKLKLELHPDKVSIKTLSSGVDFLGWVNFIDHRILRTATKKRMFRNLRNNNKIESVNSYLGLLRHGDAYKIKKIIFGKFMLTIF